MSDSPKPSINELFSRGRGRARGTPSRGRSARDRDSSQRRPRSPSPRSPSPPPTQTSKPSPPPTQTSPRSPSPKRTYVPTPGPKESPARTPPPRSTPTRASPSPLSKENQAKPSPESSPKTDKTAPPPDIDTSLLVELAGFEGMRPSQREIALEKPKRLYGFRVVWVDSTHGIAVFPTATTKKDFLGAHSKEAKYQVKEYEQFGPECKAYPLESLPRSKRIVVDSAAARRMIAAALDPTH